MSKRRRPGEVFATDLPCIRDWIALDETDRRVAETRTWDAKQWAREYFGPLQDAEIVVATLERSMFLVREGLLSDDAQLWWVAPRMSELAAEADATMPEWTPAASRPSRCGVVAWAGGTGLTTPEGRDVQGATWVSFPDGGFSLTPLIMDPTGPSGVLPDWDSSCMWVDPTPLGPGVKVPPLTSARRFGERMWRRLGATWLLAQSPTVGVIRGVKHWRRDPERPFAKPTLPAQITQVTLREMDYGNPEINGQKRPGQGPSSFEGIGGSKHVARSERGESPPTSLPTSKGRMAPRW